MKHLLLWVRNLNFRVFVLQNTFRKCTKMCVTRACSMVIFPSFLKLPNIIGWTNKIIAYSRCSMNLNTFGCRTLQNSIMKEFEPHLSLWRQCEQVYNNNIPYPFFSLKIIPARILRSYSTTRIGWNSRGNACHSAKHYPHKTLSLTVPLCFLLTLLLTLVIIPRAEINERRESTCV